MSSTYLRVSQQLRSNPGQWSAYESEGNCVVLAGPGSGKTKTLTLKLARMLAEDVSTPRGVACITYSNECASELKGRLQELGVRESSTTFIGTVHSFCFTQIIRPFAHLTPFALSPDVKVASQIRQSEVFAAALVEVMGVDENPFQWIHRVNYYRRVNLDRTPKEDAESQVGEVAKRYEELLFENELIDFEGIVTLGLRLLEQNEWIRKCIRAKYPILAVDEYQDLGPALHRIVTTLQETGVRLFVVGDPDQSIYGFSGAQPKLIEELADQITVEPTKLRFNYRSGNLIVNASRHFIGSNIDYTAHNGYSGSIDFHRRPRGISEQAEFICKELIPEIQNRRPDVKLGQIAILYRSKNEGDIISREATNSDIPFVRFDTGAPFVKTPLIRWLISCAKWTAGGWMECDPKFSDILSKWNTFNKSGTDQTQRAERRRELIRFLFSNRIPDYPLSEWLGHFHSQILLPLFERESMIEDEIEAFNTLLSASADDPTMEGMTVAVFGKQTGVSDYLNLTTLHSSKGLEWEVVIMFGMDQGIIPWANEDPASKRESRRLFYVGITRAIHEVHLTYSGWTTNRYGRRFNNGPSEFLTEIKDRLIESQTSES